MQGPIPLLKIAKPGDALLKVKCGMTKYSCPKSTIGDIVEEGEEITGKGERIEGVRWRREGAWTSSHPF